MRLIGNKTKLLGAIEELLFERGIRRGTLIDIFAGTASVGRHFKNLGFQVVANDRLSMCYAQAVARIEVSRYPTFRRFRRRYASVLNEPGFRELLPEEFPGDTSARSRPLLEAVHFLNRSVEPRRGMIYRSFSPDGPCGRKYFRAENAAKIDGILEFLRASRSFGLLARNEFYLLLASLLDAADRVANISGTYGAYLKSWQSNSRKDLLLTPPAVSESSLRHRVHHEDANELVSRIDGDVLYVDPPYNRRQYAANYHVMEIIAEYHDIDDLESFEASLYGKTGLRPYDDLKSAYCKPPGGRGSGRVDVLMAMEQLILATRAQHVVVSYNEEGLLSREQIGGILAKFSGESSYDFRRDFRAVRYKRFRSDSDRTDGHRKGARSYKVLEGRRRDEITEWLFYGSRNGRKKPAPVTSPARARPC